MNLRSFLSVLAFCMIFVGICGYQKAQAQTNASKSNSQAIKSSPAYAEILLKKTEVESEVESLLVSYTEDFPKVKESRVELGLLQKDLQTLLAQSDASKLTLALGKLMARRTELNADLLVMQQKFGEDHPEVKRAKKKVSIFDNAIKEILP